MTKRQAVRWALGICGLALLILGAAQGGYQTTMAKAIRICMECIGIGEKKECEAGGVPAQVHPAGQRPAL